MTLRVAIDNRSQPRTVVLHGRLDAETLGAFAAIAVELSAGMRCDLSNLQSADELSLDLLASLHSRGVEMVGASPYIAMCMDEARKNRREP